MDHVIHFDVTITSVQSNVHARPATVPVEFHRYLAHAQTVETTPRRLGPGNKANYSLRLAPQCCAFLLSVTLIIGSHEEAFQKLVTMAAVNNRLTLVGECERSTIALIYIHSSATLVGFAAAMHFEIVIAI